ncbi:unnamed protein product [Prunus armeniaca]
MADLFYHSKRLNLGQKLNLNFAADATPLPRKLSKIMRGRMPQKKPPLPKVLPLPKELVTKPLVMRLLRDFAHDPVPDSERASSDSRVIIPGDTILVGLIPKVGLRSAFFNQVEAQCECFLICLRGKTFRSVSGLADLHEDNSFRTKSEREWGFSDGHSVGCPNGPQCF